MAGGVIPVDRLVRDSVLAKELLGRGARRSGALPVERDTALHPSHLPRDVTKE